MALPVIEIDGTDVVDADEVADRSVSIRRRSLDLTLINPSTFPSVGDTVTCDAPAWTGTINRLQTREWDDQEGNKRKTTEVRARDMVLLGGPPGGGGGDSGASRRPSSGTESSGGGSPITDDDIPF